MTIDIVDLQSYLARRLFRFDLTVVIAQNLLDPMARTPQDITDAELAVLSLLWNRGRSTVRELTDILYPNGTGAHYATVQKLLERLEIKKFVKRDRKPWPHQFESRIDREELIGRRLQTTADKLCGGSLVPLMNHLVKSQLTAEDRRSLRGLLDELETGVN